MQLIPLYALRVVGLLIIGVPIVVAGYAVLRDDELEPFRGRALYWRTGICLLVYVAAWGLYAAIPDDLKSDAILWLVWAPLMVAPAATAAYFAFELDAVGSVIHACFFLLVTLALGATAGLDMPWSPTPPGGVNRVTPGTQLEIVRE